MIRVFAIVLGAGIVALLGGFLYLGASPPKPHIRDMHVVLPNTRFSDNPTHK